MGIIVKQSFQNFLITSLGFAVGALNTLFLYTRILPDVYYGLVTFILALGVLVMPLVAFGAHTAILRFYSSYPEAEKGRFFTLMLFTPLLGSLLVVGLVLCFQQPLAYTISRVNPLVRDYMWYGVGVGVAMAYFEVFYAWCRVQFRSVFGHAMKELFGRIGVSVLLLLLYGEFLSLSFFFKALIGIYMLRTALLSLYAFRLRMPAFSFRVPTNTCQVLGYSFLLLLGSSASLILLEIDKVMLNQFLTLDYVAYYSVAVYIATVIVTPSRAMRQIVYPLTAQLLNTDKAQQLQRLYQKTSLTLFIASGLLFLLIMLNVEDVYRLLPQAYRNGFAVVFWIGLAKVSESLLGNTNAILYNSAYYKVALGLGLGVAVLTIALNVWLIPRWGLEGAALATFSAVASVNLLKLGIIRHTFGIWPFTPATLKVFAIFCSVGALFYLLPFSFSPLLNIALQSACIVLLYGGLLYRFTGAKQLLRGKSWREIFS